MRKFSYVVSAALFSALPAFGKIAPGQSTLIHGSLVPLGKYPAIIYLMDGERGCSASVVGPRAVLTAGHCGGTGSHSILHVGDLTYQANMAVSPDFNDRFSFLDGTTIPDLDLSIGIVEKEIADVAPLSIGGVANLGEQAILFGYGCTNLNGEGDGKLHANPNYIQKFLGSGFVLSEPASGAIGCSGDSGGPSLVTDRQGKEFILGVHSQSDFTTSTWDVRTDSPEARAFFLNVAQKNKIEICGITRPCP